MARGSALVSAFLLLSAWSAAAHKHHDELTEEQANAPVDTILWLHIFLQAAVWGILFPTGMVLGLSRSRWHVPLQVRRGGRYLRDLTSNFSLECRICSDRRRVHPWTFT